MTAAHAQVPTVKYLNSISDMPSPGSSGYLYFNTLSSSSADLTFTVNDSNLELYTNTSIADLSDTHASDSTSARAYVLVATNIPYGSSKTFGNGESSPAATIYIKNAGYTSDGKTIDAKISLNKIAVQNSSNSSVDNGNTSVIVYSVTSNNVLYQGTHAMCAGVSMDITITFYYTGTTDVVEGYASNWYVYDLDQPDKTGTSSSYAGSYTESLALVSGFDDTVYLSSNTLLTQSTITYDGTQCLKFTATDADESSFLSGILASVSSGQFRFVWYGSRCGTVLQLRNVALSEIDIDQPVKSVSDTVASLGSSLTYTVTETIPYTSSANAYETITFSDTLDDALDIDASTMTIYRTDTLNGTTRVNDTSNWNITKIGQTITATCKNPSDAGGDYEFVITTKISSDADLSSHSTTTNTSGTTYYIIPNQASIQCGSQTEYSNTVETLIEEKPSISLVKDTKTETYVVDDAEAGVTKVTYTFTITNTGNVTLNNITLVDEKLGGDISSILTSTSLALGESITVEKTYTLTQDDIDAGSIYNTATVTGYSPSNKSVTATDNCTVTITWSPDIELVKTSTSGSTIDNAYAGDEITYSITVTNTGNVTLNNLRIYDELNGIVLDLSNVPDTLAPSESFTVTATYTLTQEDVDRGYVDNHAFVTAETPDGKTSVSDDDDETVGISSNPSISLVKTANVEVVEDANAGTSTITYSFTVTNTGNTTLDNIVLTDPLFVSSTVTLYDAGETASVTSLAPGEQVTGAATYTLTQDDIDAGYVTNTATVTGKTPGGVTVSGTDTATVSIEQNPEVSLTKTASTDTVEDAWAGNSTITYYFTITNTGNVTLDDFTLADEKLGGDLSYLLSDVISLAPNESKTVSETYTLTQDDIDAASVYNTATVTAYSPLDKRVENNDNCTVGIVWTPEIVLEKTSLDGDTIEDAYAGDEIAYSITVTNTGNVTLSNVSVCDALEGVSINTTNLTSTLAPSENFTVTATYTLTQDDIDRGYVDNHAFVTSSTPDGEPGVDDDDEETVELPSNPSIELVKVATVDIVENAKAGTSTITYSFTVTNTGNTTLDNIVLTDPLIGSSSITLYDVNGNATSTLAPDEQAFGTATYVVTQDDIDAGIVENTATVIGDDPHDDPADDTDDEDVEIERLPSIDLVKEVVGNVTIEDAYAGDLVQFAVTITNTGNTTLYNATITDLLEGATFVVDERKESVTFTEDNTVIVEKMSPGDSVTVYVDYQLLQSDVDRGDTENIASVVADPPTGLEQVTDEDDAMIETPSNPSISLVKVANVESVEFALPGDVIYYTLTITNTGNTTISNLALYDELLAGELEVFVDEKNDEENSDDTFGTEVENKTNDAAAGNTDGSEDEVNASTGDETVYRLDAGNVSEALDTLVIAPGESAVAIIQYTLTQDDIDAGYVYNTASATGEDPHGTIIDSEDDYTVELIASPSIILTKTVAAANDVADEDLTVGDELTYTFIIANNGNQTITDIALYDELLGGDIDLTNATKGIDMTVIGYKSAEENMDEETVENANADSTLAISSRAYYTEHTAISVNDPITTLCPGEYLIVEVNYTLTQDDLNNGRVDNTATTIGTTPDGSSVDNDDTVVMYLPQHPSIALVKEASLETLTAASVGDIVYYTLTITNTGNVSLQNIVLTDELDGIIIDTSVLDGLVLAPSETVVVTAEYALTNADIQAGNVYNHATVTAESVVPYDEGNIWSGAQQISDDDDVLVDGIVGISDDLILPQTSDIILLAIAASVVALLSAASIIAGSINRRKKTNR